jgi:nitrogen fixation protein NifU and related proteins
MAFEEIYREIVLEHSRKPRNKGVLEAANVKQKGVNASCGDEIELQLLLEGDVIRQAKFTGVGCAISQASASLMTLALEGRKVSEALELAHDFSAMIHGETPKETLGDLAAFQGVSKLHARVKCATLPWQTLSVALKRSGEEVTATLE